jgi:predicted GIY-YIG superfamily endonuclease
LHLLDLLFSSVLERSWKDEKDGKNEKDEKDGKDGKDEKDGKDDSLLLSIHLVIDVISVSICRKCKIYTRKLVSIIVYKMAILFEDKEKGKKEKSKDEEHNGEKDGGEHDAYKDLLLGSFQNDYYTHLMEIEDLMQRVKNLTLLEKLRNLESNMEDGKEMSIRHLVFNNEKIDGGTVYKGHVETCFHEICMNLDRKTSIYHDQYFGATSNPTRRFKQHRKEKQVDSMKILYFSSRMEKASHMEQLLIERSLKNRKLSWTDNTMYGGNKCRFSKGLAFGKPAYLVYMLQLSRRLV